MLTALTLATSQLKALVHRRNGLVLAVWGEAGIGKTYWTRELLQAASCQSLSLHATTPLAKLAQSVPRPKKLALWAEHNLTRLGKGAAVESTTVLDSLGALFAGIAPFVLHLEDIHEADPERARFVQELAKLVLRIKGAGLMVTSRREPPEPFTGIKLEPLSEQKSASLLEQELKANLPKEALKWIYDKAAGNPLYTLEYLRYLTRQGFLWNDGKDWHWRKPLDNVMPVTVEALIEQLINRAKSEPLQTQVLEAKAILPMHIPDELWARIAGLTEPDLQAAITELSQQGLFKASDFAHPLFREVTLKTISTARKRNLSRQAIQVLKDSPAQAAAFVDDAGLEPAQALAILKQAAEHKKTQSEVEAARFLAKAVAFAEAEEKGNLALEAATALQHHDIPQALALIEQILHEEPNNFEALYLGTLLYGLDAQEAKAKQLFSQLPSSERESQRGIETLLEMNRALENYDDFLTIWQQNKRWQPALEPRFISIIVYILSQQAKSQEAIQLAIASLKRSDLSVERRTSLLNSLGAAYSDCGEHKQAVETYNQLIDLFANHLNPRNLAITLDNRALAKKWLGQCLEAKSDSLRSYQLASEIGDSYHVAVGLSKLGEIEVELGEYEEAERYLTDSLALFQRRHVTPNTVDAETNTTVLYLTWQSPHSGILALKHAYTALAYAREVKDAYSIVDALFHASLAEAIYGSVTRALELADELDPLAKRNGTPIDMYYAAWAKAKALASPGRFDESRAFFQRAFEAAHQAKHELMANKIGLELDQLNNDLESARRRMQWFAERGLMNGVNIAKRYFPALADSPRPLTLEPKLRLEVLGTLQIIQQNESQPMTNQVRGRKRQELLALLLEARIAGRSEVSRLTLLDILYPDEDELKASSSLKSVVHSLRETFGERLIATTTNGYSLGNCNSDAEAFLQNRDISLWRGLYLEGLEFASESPVRDSLYLALHSKLQEVLEEQPEEAARVASILIEAESYNTDYLKTYLTALRLSNSHAKLVRHFEAAKKRLLEVGESLPKTWQHFLKVA